MADDNKEELKRLRLIAKAKSLTFRKQRGSDPTTPALPKFIAAGQDASSVGTLEKEDLGYEEPVAPTPKEERGTENLFSMTKGIQLPGMPAKLNIDLARTAQNAPGSFRNMMRGFRDAPGMLPDMAMTVAGLPSELVRRIAEPFLPDDVNDKWDKEPLFIGEAYAKSMIDGFYHRARNAKQTIEEDPFGAAMDVAGAVQGAGRLATGKSLVTANLRAAASEAASPLTKPAWAATGYVADKAAGTANKLTEGALGLTSNIGEMNARTIRLIAKNRKVEPVDIARTGGNIRDAYRFDAIDREEFLAARRGQKSSMSLYEDSRRILEGIKQEEVAAYKTAFPKMKADPRTLSLALDDLKLSVLDELKAFRVSPKGRNIVVEGRRVKDVPSGMEAGFFENNPLKPVDAGTSNSTIKPGLRQVVEESKRLKEPRTVYVDPQTGLPLSEAEAVAKNYDLTTLKTQDRPGRATSLKMGHLLEIGGDDLLNVGDLTPGQKADMVHVVKMVLDQEKSNIVDLDALKQALDGFIEESKLANPSSKASAFAGKMRERVKDILVEHAKGETPDGDYANVMKRYEDMIETRRAASALIGLDSKNPETAIGKLIDSVTGSHKRELREQYVRALELMDDGTKSWQERSRLRARIAGIQSQDLFGSGLIGRSIGAAALSAGGGLFFGGDPVIAALAGIATWGASSSPRAVSHALGALGIAQSEAKNITSVVRKIHESAKAKGLVLEGLTYSDAVRRLRMTDVEREVAESEDRKEEAIELKMLESGVPYTTAKPKGQ